MPDETMMVGFNQATGPVDPSKRAQAPPSLKQRLGTEDLPSGYDFWGLQLSARYLRSADGGDRWSEVRADRYRSLYPQSHAAQGTIALEDGSLLRRVNGFDLAHDRSVPQTAYLQRLAPGARNWSPPQVLLDERRYIYQLSRIRRLRDGRLVALGQYWRVPAGSSRARLDRAPASHLLMVSGNDGRTWRRNPVDIPRNRYVTVNEWDVAEVPNGDLVAVFRSGRSPRSSEAVRRQGLFTKRGRGWELTRVSDAPFPHAGHPELLSTREGVVLHIATTGIHWTADAGRTWKPVRFFSPEAEYGSEYYPQSLQTRDGVIHVFGHVGSDDPYGRVDQAIVMDTFRLVPSSAPYPGGPADSSAGTGGPGSARAFAACRAAAPDRGFDLRGRRGGAAGSTE